MRRVLLFVLVLVFLFVPGFRLNLNNNSLNSPTLYKQPLSDLSLSRSNYQLTFTPVITVHMPLIFVAPPALAAPSITNVTDNRADYAGGQIPKYEKFEITFDITGITAQNMQLPFDPNPPVGMETSANPLHQGISVDAEFTPDNWQTVYKQPAFIFQPMLEDIKVSWDGSEQEWYYPEGDKVWKVRFSPNKTGTWKYRLTAFDAGGKTQSPEQSFEVIESTNKGFIQVSPSDPRYFEFEDGTPFLSYGVQMGAIMARPILDNEPRFQRLVSSNITLVRIWRSSALGVAWPQWGIMGGDAPGMLGYLPRTALLPIDKVNDQPILTWQIDYEEGNVGWFGACMFKRYSDSEAVKRNTNYRLKVTYYGENITGPRDSSSPDYGVVAKITDWWLNDCAEPVNSQYNVTDYGHSTNGQWGTLEGTWNSEDNDFLPRIYVSLENVSAVGNDFASRAKANILSISLQEDLGNGQFGPEIIDEYSMQYGLYYDEPHSYAMDKFIELAEQYGIYLKIVLMDKNDNLFYKLDDDGTFVINGESDNQDGFYGLGRSLNKTRWIQEAYYRYFQARWGYSTAIHSWELTNEGDPSSWKHWQTTDELGKSMHCRVFGVDIGRNDGEVCTFDHPNDHLVTTSFWHSFPVYNSDTDWGMWNSPHYPNVDYADGHAYISTSPASDTDKALMQYDAAYYHLWHGQAWGGWDFAFPVVRGEAGMVPFDGTSDSITGLGIQNDLRGIWFHNYVWAGLDHNALYEIYWYYNNHIYDAGVYDHGIHHQHYVTFLENIPITNGKYRDPAVLVSNPQLRVVGQKDVVNNRAHLWVQNIDHTWKNVVDGVLIPSQSGTVTLGGFTPNTSLSVEWWDTYTGTISKTEQVTTSSTGDLSLEITNLTNDLALKIGDYQSQPP